MTGELREFSGTRPGDTKEPLERPARGGFTRPGERGGARDMEDSVRMGTEIEIDPRLLALQGTRPADPAPSEAALAAPRSDVEALKDGAAMLVQAGNRVAAIALLWSAIAIEPLDLGAHRRLAAMLANAGDPDGAANEYARYIDFVLPTGDVGRAAAELSYGATMLGGHPALHEAAEKIALAVRALVPALPEPAPLPIPRLLPKVDLRFCVHDDGRYRWLQLEGGHADLAPSAVRLLDGDDNVLNMRPCIAIAHGQKGHAPAIDGEPPSVAWAVLGVSDDVVAALDAGDLPPYRIEAQIGDEWLSTSLADTGCRVGRRAARAAVS